MIMRGYELLGFAEKNGVEGEELEKLEFILDTYKERGVRVWLESCRAAGTGVDMLVLRMLRRGGGDVAYCYWIHTPVGLGKGWAWRLGGSDGTEAVEMGIPVEEAPTEQDFYRHVAERLYDELLAWASEWGGRITHDDFEAWREWRMEQA